jgi:acetylornithine deacetylase/succinyl-diaminopimelate desuccinylase-like protein
MATRRWPRVAFVSLVLAAAAALGLVPLAAPEPRSADAPAGVFSSGRAIQHVAVIAREPHPAGSPEMATVARYLREELDRLGVEVSTQRAQGRDGVVLRNTAARVAGRSSTGAVLVVSHPDSVPYGPGAGDNATGAAVALEMVRALAVSRRPRNDVIVLFDDGEETGF